MQHSHGVTIERQALYDNPDAALQIPRSQPRRLRAGEMAESVASGPRDGKGRVIATLPDPQLECDAELAGKSPEEIVEILERREDDDHTSTDRIMREYPGKSADAPRSSSSSGKRHRKPSEPFDHTKGSVHDIRDVGDLRPHPVAGRISTQALAGIKHYETDGINAGTMLDAIGRALNAGVSWARIDYMLGELRARPRTRQAG